MPAVQKNCGWLPPLRCGCGEHGADPDSVKFFQKAVPAYVSGSPYRVPVVRPAAAQAAIEEKRAPAPSKAAPANKTAKKKQEDSFTSHCEIGRPPGKPAAFFAFSFATSGRRTASPEFTTAQRKK